MQKKAKEVAQNIPIEYLLLETDDPYLTPVPYRGTENQPAYVSYVAQEIANLRNTTIDIIADETTKKCVKNISKTILLKHFQAFLINLIQYIYRYLI